jgi:glutamate--cysteine ligase
MAMWNLVARFARSEIVVRQVDGRAVRGAPTRESADAQGASPEPPRYPGEPVTEDQAVAHLAGVCFKTGPPPRLIGAELEWIVQDECDPRAPLESTRLAAALDGLAPLPGGSLLTIEPGGQVELSSRPADSIGACVDDLSGDLALLREALRSEGMVALGAGHDPWRPPRRLLGTPRYAAMEEFFDRTGAAGRAMMCSTASVQVCVDAGDDAPGSGGLLHRWRLTHLLGPVLVAAFANSPLRGGRPSGWKSLRQAVWADMERTHTAAPPTFENPSQTWVEHALDAHVMCIPGPEDAAWHVPAGLTFREWIGGGGLRRPTLADLDYHLTTLFPPVRPRGHLELRMIDAQPQDGWVVAAAVVGALLDNAEAADAALAAVEALAEPDAPRGGAWLRAARLGLEDPELRRAAASCFTAALAALERDAAPAPVRAAVSRFTEEYVLAGRCPADDLLEDRRSPSEHREQESL